MPLKEKLEDSSEDSLPNVISSGKLPDTYIPKKGHGYYALNLAFNCEDEALLETRSANDVYCKLSHPVRNDEVDYSAGALGSSRNHNVFFTNIWKTAISGCLLAATIILLYLWIHVRFIHPMVTDVFRVNASSPAQFSVIPRIGRIYTHKPDLSEWDVEVVAPAGLTVLKLNAKDLQNPDSIACPKGKFALALYIESDSKLAENWLAKCGKNVAYFRIDGHLTQDDVDRLIKYLKVAEFLPLKVNVNVEKGGGLEDNEKYQSTLLSDEIISTVKMSGYITPKTINEIIEAVPYAEELVIEGSQICKSLQRSPKTSEAACQVTWEELHKLHIVGTDECRGLYDLIYSCWSMPKLEVLQIRNSIISDPNSNYISTILNRYRITKVDFADNTCFDETLQTYPFMCQASS